MSFGTKEQKGVEIIADIFSRFSTHHVASFNSKACLDIAILVQRPVWIKQKYVSTIKNGWREVYTTTSVRQVLFVEQ